MDILNIMVSAMAILVSIFCTVFSYTTQKATKATLRKIERVTGLGAQASASSNTTLNGQNPYGKKIEEELQ